MIILHAGPVAWQRIAGPSASIPGLVDAQNRTENVQAALLITVPNQGIPPVVDFPVFDLKTLFRNSGPLGLPTPFDQPDLVVFHSTYYPRHALLARRLVRHGIPYVLCPRGGMSPMAQNWKWWKKRLGNALFFNRLVARAEALHCLTKHEANDCRLWHRPVFVVGNGITLPKETDMARPGNSNTRRFLFLGRLIVQIKGLDLLLNACARIRSHLETSHAKIEMYGPDVEGGEAWLSNRIAQLGLSQIVRMRGPVIGDAKKRAFSSADIFLHPSRTEGHPMAVLEATSYGLPCLLTPGTSMAEEVVDAGAGWRVEPTPDGIAAGLLEGLNASSDQLAEAGANARHLAIEHFAWKRVANSALQAYRKFAA